MKKLKKIFAAAAITALLLTLCSCINMEYGIIIEKDGSARAYFEADVKKSALEGMGLSSDEFLTRTEESVDSDDWDKRETFSREIDGAEYFAARYYKDSTIDELPKSGMTINESISSNISVSREGGDLVVNVVMGSDAAAESGDAAALAENGMLNAVFRIKAPYRVKETNGSVDKEGAVCWDMVDLLVGKTQKQELSVRYEIFPTTLLVLLVVGGAAAVAVIVVVIIAAASKGKKKKQEAYALPAGSETPERYSLTEVKASSHSTGAEEPPVQPAESFSTAPRSAVRYCKNCGEKISSSDRFCRSCGEKNES